MLELKEKPVICCGKEMQSGLGCQNMVYGINSELQEWICLECGRFIHLIEGQLDEEELENYRENM